MPIITGGPSGTTYDDPVVFTFAAQNNDPGEGVRDEVSGRLPTQPAPCRTQPAARLHACVLPRALSTPGAPPPLRAAATFECQLTYVGSVLYPWAPCISPVSYSALPVGTYTFSVRATVSRRVGHGATSEAALRRTLGLACMAVPSRGLWPGGASSRELMAQAGLC